MAVTLGSKAVGSIVKLNVNGVAREFIVIQQGNPDTSVYDSSCDGSWLLMKDVYESRPWDSSNSNDYANSDIHSYLNNTFVNLLDSNIQSAIKQVKLPYTKGTGSGGTLVTGSSGLSAQVFLLSYTEVGYSGHSTVNHEGAVLSYFNGASYADRIAYLNGTAEQWGLRTPSTTNTTNPTQVTKNGVFGNIAAKYNHGVRPALVLKSSLTVPDDGVIGVTQPAINGNVTIKSVLKPLTGEGLVKVKGVWRPIVETLVCVKGVWQSSKATSHLPDGYTEVEYIQSSGNQYIDTGFKPNGNSRILLDYESLSTATAFVFGSRHNSSANSTSYSFAFVNLGTNSVRSDFGSVESSITGTVLKRVILDKNKNVTTYDGASVTAAAQTFQSSYPITLCAINTAGTKSLYSSIKIYSCQIYDNGTLVRDFVPCKNSSGAVGLYDLVNNKFYANNGSGAFTAGPNVA